MKRQAEKIGKILLKNGLTLTVCESCTGGMLGSIITSVPGSSNYFKGGIIAYANEVKHKVVGVKKITLEKFGAVSKETAQQMAKGVKKLLDSDIGIAITGIAGPGGGTKEKPVGLVYIAVATDDKLVSECHIFSGTRETIRMKSCRHALNMLLHILKGEK